MTQELRVHGQCEELLLPYLSEAGVAAYLAQRFGEALLAGAGARSTPAYHGNPLFLVTVVEEMVRQGRLRRPATGGERLVHDDGRGIVDIPESLRRLIDQQLEQIHPEERACLEVASVAGREFSAAAGRRDRGPSGRDGGPVCGISAAGPICPGVWDRSMARWDDHGTLWLYA